jgi:hypothetical protein
MAMNWIAAKGVQQRKDRQASMILILTSIRRAALILLLALFWAVVLTAITHDASWAALAFWWAAFWGFLSSLIDDYAKSREVQR